ncbi:MAG: helix-turn-helix transcriptional regulator [Clostridia bacterium]|nr:helix-turn-helix transcriptional regulator [Clostridia bacterium]
MSLGDIVSYKYTGENLKKLRKQRKISQIMMQTETGIEQALISKFENGKRIPPTDTLVLLADYYGTNIDYLLDRTDNPQKI